MASNPNEQLPWEAGDTPGTSPSLNVKGPRSALSLGGGATPMAAPATESAGPQRDLVAEGATRARNMATALVMIVVLLAKYVAVKVVWRRMQTLGTRGFLVGSRLLQAFYVVIQPHLVRLREQAKATSNKAFKTVLLALIAVEAIVKLLGVAKVEAAKLAAQSTRTLGQVLAPIGAAIGQAIKAGLTRPAFRKLAAKLIHILEEAQL
jgi:hypothetical protein